jgi:hypothetical protein
MPIARSPENQTTHDILGVAPDWQIGIHRSTLWPVVDVAAELLFRQSCLMVPYKVEIFKRLPLYVVQTEAENIHHGAVITWT